MSPFNNDNDLLALVQLYESSMFLQKYFRLIICIIIILVICDTSIIFILRKEYNVINYPKKMLND